MALVEQPMQELPIAGEATLQAVTTIYAVCNGLRVLSYAPQILAVARESSGAHAISIGSWLFWFVSHAVTAVYGAEVLNDSLLAGMMWGNAAGCLAIAAITITKRRRYGWVRFDDAGKHVRA